MASLEKILCKFMPSIQWELFNFQCSANSGPQDFLTVYPQPLKYLDIFFRFSKNSPHTKKSKTSTTTHTRRQIENCMGCPNFHKSKVQMKIFQSPTGFHLFLIHICRMACHVPVTRTTWNHLWKSQYFQWVFTYENIEFKIHTFLFTFKFILIWYLGFLLKDNYS